MKKCPRCQTDYYDNMLEFCLEDGAKLFEVSRSTKTAVKPFNEPAQSVETVMLDRAEVPQTIVSEQAAPTVEQQQPTKTEVLKQKAVEKGSRLLEISAVVFALAHNWWQWLRVGRQNYNSATDFLLSAEFLIWLLLLATGTVLGLLALKLCQRKGFAATALVVLAVNFLLFLVPLK